LEKRPIGDPDDNDIDIGPARCLRDLLARGAASHDFDVCLMAHDIAEDTPQQIRHPPQ
jgi:hypothetical protein